MALAHSSVIDRGIVSEDDFKFLRERAASPFVGTSKSCPFNSRESLVGRDGLEGRAGAAPLIVIAPRWPMMNEWMPAKH